MLPVKNQESFFENIFRGGITELRIAVFTVCLLDSHEKIGYNQVNGCITQSSPIPLLTGYEG